MDQIELRDISERTLVSILRTAIYAGLGALFALGHGDVKVVLDATVLGAVLADYITWLARSLMQLPNHLAHGGYEAAINLVFATIFFHFARFEVTDDGSSLMFAFVSFMLVLGVKIGYYGLQTVTRNMVRG